MVGQHEALPREQSPGDGAKHLLLFPTSPQALWRASWARMHGVVHLLARKIAHLLRTTFPRLPCHLTSCYVGPKGSTGRRLQGRKRGEVT